MIELKTVNLRRARVETLVVPVCEGQEIYTDATLTALVEMAKAQPEFTGKAGEMLTLFQPTDTKVSRALFYGIGKAEKIDGESFRKVCGKAVGYGIKAGLTNLTVAVASDANLAIDAQTIFKSLMEGALLGNRLFDRYKEKKEKKPLKRVTLMATAAQKRTYGELTETVAAICEGSVAAREWVSMPSNDKRPPAFAKLMQETFKGTGLKTSVKDETWLTKQKFGAMLAVGQGSDASPRLVTVEYAPKGALKTVVLVGKGVTFDSGGLSLKPAGSMETMKMDMAGAAAVAGTMLAVAKLKPDIKVVGVMPLVENMPSGTAIRPGDIVRSYAGKTIEIGNTDAEGRLILIDAMAWAVKTYKPDTMIDLATLTGACVIALGEKIAGVFSGDRQLAESLVASGEATNERCWAMPLPEDYKKLLKNEFADLSNMSSSRYGGAIAAALFLSEFVGDTRWAHIDIAGPAWIKKASDYCTAGGTGFGVRLLCDWMCRL